MPHHLCSRFSKLKKQSFRIVFNLARASKTFIERGPTDRRQRWGAGVTVPIDGRDEPTPGFARGGAGRGCDQPPPPFRPLTGWSVGP